MAQLVTVPYLGTAEEDVLVAEWLVDVGEGFAKGQALVVLETLKASFEVEAELDGVLLRRLAEKGARVPLHAALGVAAAEAGEEIDEAELEAQIAKLAGGSMVGAGLVETADGDATARASAGVASADGIGAGGSGGRSPASPAARRRARALGVELGALQGSGRNGMITVEDVEAAHAGGASAGAPAATAPADGRLDPSFVEHLRRERDAFAALSSDFKVALYRKHGAILGEGVRFGARACIVAERLVLGAGVRFGDDVRVDALHFEAGALTQLSGRCRFRARKIVLGENAFFAPDAEVGGGGVMDPEAELRVGSHGFVGEFVHLNPCRPLVLGDEVTISRNASLMTHSFANSVLEGYPVRFAGLEVGDGCQIGIACTLFPGVTMGAGSILMSNSCLVTSMPAARVFAGSPAADIKPATEVVDDARRLQLALRIVDDFAAALQARGYAVDVERADDERRRVRVEVDGARHELRFARALDGGAGDFVAEDLRLCLEASAEEWDGLSPELCAIDLHEKRIRGSFGPLGAALREFLRKRGIRLEPRTWTYPGGWL